MSAGEKSIRVVPAAGGEAKGSKSVFGLAPEPVTLKTSVLRSNLKAFLGTISDLVAGVPESVAPFDLDEIELTVEINAEGSVQLVGGLKVGASGGITLRLKRQASNAP
jgi:hypothetical protein